jgi:hypothetical protein
MTSHGKFGEILWLHTYMLCILVVLNTPPLPIVIQLLSLIFTLRSIGFFRRRTTKSPFQKHFLNRRTTEGLFQEHFHHNLFVKGHEVLAQQALPFLLALCIPGHPSGLVIFLLLPFQPFYVFRTEGALCALSITVEDFRKGGE